MRRIEKKVQAFGGRRFRRVRMWDTLGEGERDEGRTARPAWGDVGEHERCWAACRGDTGMPGYGELRRAGKFYRCPNRRKVGGRLCGLHVRIEQEAKAPGRVLFREVQRVIQEIRSGRVRFVIRGRDVGGEGACRRLWLPGMVSARLVEVELRGDGLLVTVEAV